MTYILAVQYTYYLVSTSPDDDAFHCRVCIWFVVVADCSKGSKSKTAHTLHCRTLPAYFGAVLSTVTRYKYNSGPA